jgi:hypothetical protein
MALRHINSLWSYVTENTILQPRFNPTPFFSSFLSNVSLLSEHSRTQSFILFCMLLLLMLFLVLQPFQLQFYKWAMSRQNQHNGFATSMDPYEPAHPRSLIRIHAVRLQTLKQVEKLIANSMDPDQTTLGCAGWSGSMLVVNPLCWFCRDTAQMFLCPKGWYIRIALSVCLPCLSVCASLLAQHLCPERN